jgi:hypothetical protein
MQPKRGGLGLFMLAMVLLGLVGGPARAQDGSELAQGPPPSIRAMRLASGSTVRLETSFRTGASLAVGEAPRAVLHRGPATGALAMGHDKVLVALGVDHATSPFVLRMVQADGTVSAPRPMARPVARRDIPFAVAATATPDGFAVFFQEIQADNPANAHTYLLKLDRDGKPIGGAASVAVPWALAAAAHNGHGFHLALFYSRGRAGTRLSMVSLNEAGAPEQHPDWASRPGLVRDVQLVARPRTDQAPEIRAIFRGGTGGDRLMSRDVTSIGRWGNEPSPSRDLGAIATNQAILMHGGKPTRIAAR